MTQDEIFSFSKEEIIPITEKFTFAAVGLSHSHIYGMTNSLIKAGAVLKWVYDDNEALLRQYTEKYPYVQIADSIDRILCDKEVGLVISADIPSKRAELAIKTMKAGINFFVDKAPALTLDECEKIKKAQTESGKKYFVYYSELIENDAAIFANALVKRGVIGRLCHVDIFAPHRLNPESRPKWFFQKAHTGGIITDIGSHQIEQFLEFTGCSKAEITGARVANYFNKEYPEFEDFGDVTIRSENGATGYIRVDWLSPAGIKTFGDLRATLVGEKGYIELRKNCNLGVSQESNNVFVALDEGVFSQSVTGKLDRPYFNRLINDCITGSDTAMSRDILYSAMELTVKAQEKALNGK